MSRNRAPPPKSAKPPAPPPKSAKPPAPPPKTSKTPAPPPKSATPPVPPPKAPKPPAPPRTAIESATGGESLRLFPAEMKFKHLENPLPQSKSPRICAVCGLIVDGAVYHCEAKGLDVHPKCRLLRKKIICEIKGIRAELFLENEAAKSKCLECHMFKPNGPVEGFLYQSRNGKLTIHLSCIQRAMSRGGSKTESPRPKKMSRKNKKWGNAVMNNIVDVVYDAGVSFITPNLFSN